MRIDLNADAGETPADVPSADADLMRVRDLGQRRCRRSRWRFGVDPRDRSARPHPLPLPSASHPGFNDREGFGRREMNVAPFDLERLVLEQIVAVATAAADEGVELQHVKPHGALYSMAARDIGAATAVAAAVALFDRGLLLVGPPGSQLVAAARAAGLRPCVESLRRSRLRGGRFAGVARRPPARSCTTPRWSSAARCGWRSIAPWSLSTAPSFRLLRIRSASTAILRVRHRLPRPYAARSKTRAWPCARRGEPDAGAP